MCVIASPTFGDRAYRLAPAIVPMAEFGKASSFESVIVSHNPPNIQIMASAAATRNDFAQCNTVLTALPCDRAGDDYDSPLFFFLKRKIIKSAILVHFHTNTPRNVACRQIAGILDTNVAKNTIAIAEKMNSARLNSNIGALEDSSITLLGESGIPRRFPQLVSGPPQSKSKERSGYCGDSNEPLVSDCFEYAGHHYKKKYVERGAFIWA
jgi:hypothetical protein